MGSVALSLAVVLAGFSVVSALQLIITHFRPVNYGEQRTSQWLGVSLVSALAGLQWAHFVWLFLDQPWVDTAVYRCLLFAVAPVFWAYSQPLLNAERAEGWRMRYLVHALPVVWAPWLTSSWALPLAFVLGAGYLLALAHSVYRLRAQRDEYRKEIALLSIIFAVALLVTVLALWPALLPGKLFFVLYASAIGLAFFLVQIVLGLRPQLSVEVTETVKASTSYATTTLTRIDCDAVLAQLDALMNRERLYENAELNLSTLAQRLHLTTHQLSELVNVHIGKNFSRYLREIRIDAAKKMLCAEPAASVLSVGLCVGFSAQSNFYEAFREIEGMTPGQYRKLHLGAEKMA